MPFLRTDQVTLYYEVHGKGHPIVLLHGFTSSFRGTWQASGWVTDLMAWGFRVIGLDLRGHGKSEKPHDSTAYLPEQLCQDVGLIMDHLGVQRADLIGFSMGGGIALNLAMEHRERFHRIVIAGVGDAAIQGMHDPEELAQIALAMELEDARDITSSIGKQIRLYADQAGNDRKALAALLHSGGWPGYLPTLMPIAPPLLIVLAENDPYMRTIHCLQAGLPQAQCATLSGVSHTMLIGDQRFRELVRSFLQAEPDKRERSCSAEEGLW